MAKTKETKSQVHLQQSTVNETDESLTAISVRLLEERLAKIVGHLNSKIMEMLEAVRLLLAERCTSSSADKENLESGSANPKTQIEPQDSNASDYFARTMLAKINFPKFNGSDVEDWVFRCDEIFSLDQTPEHLKIKLASIHMEGRAFTWHRSHIRSEDYKEDWNLYKEAAIERFGEMNDPITELKRLQETEGIVEYHERFEKIRTLIDLQESHLVSLYLGGLQEDTEMHLRMFRPQSIRECFWLGRLYEAAHPRQTPTKNLGFAAANEMVERRGEGLCEFSEDEYSDGDYLVHKEKVVSRKTKK